MYSGEILFRGIPWGTSAPKTFEQLPPPFSQPEFVIPPSTGKERWTNLDSLSEYPPKHDYNHEGIGMRCNGWSTTVKLNVAGHKVHQACAYFACDLKEGKLTYNPEDTFFYCAYYHIEEHSPYMFSPGATKQKMMEGSRELIRDIHNKLTALYGENDISKRIRTGTTREERNAYHWKGANDTELILTTKCNMNEADMLISYLWHKGDEYLIKADEATDSSSVGYIKNVMGTDGL